MGARAAADQGDAPRPDAQRDRAREAGRTHAPQATLSDWEPPADDDDDRPILAGGARRPGGPQAPRASQGGDPSLDEAETAIGLPEGNAAPVMARPRAAIDDDDDDLAIGRHPRLPSLPGITEGTPSASASAALPRRDGRGARVGRGPTRERERSRGAERGPTPAPARADVAVARPLDGGAPHSPRASREREPREREPREPDARDDASLSNIFLNVGKRDGVVPEDLQKMLADAAGIPQSETNNIRVRDRITFVTVKKELADRAITALAGQVIGGRTVVAEPARDKV